MSEQVQAPPCGAAVIADHVKRLPGKPGVYRMIGGDGTVLYVGKARDLKKRVTAYAKAGAHTNRILRMITETAAMEFVVTESETEALLLEANLIKQLKPRYNVSFRDDKSFAFILIAEDHASPQIVKHRGARKRQGSYYGPFASTGAVNRTLNTLQKAFLLRSCSDSVFESRTRPCLLHQIKRCSAPCTGLIAPEDYRRLVEEAKAFLSGENTKVQQELSQEMEEAAGNLDFERAARLRDRIRALTHVQSSQDINAAGVGEADVFAIHCEGGQACIQVFFFRAGQNWGNAAFFPKHDREDEPAAILDAFLAQFYDAREPPALILTNVEPPQAALLAEALSMRAGRRVSVHCPQRGEKRAVVDAAVLNAREALARRMAESATQRQSLERLAEVLELPAPPQRIEVYDNSHIQGANAVGAMIVASPEGFVKNQYRKFNIKTASLSPGDDYGMLREVLTRRFKRLLKEEDDAEAPDLLVIDGDAAQLAVALEVLREFGIEPYVPGAAGIHPLPPAGEGRKSRSDFRGGGESENVSDDNARRPPSPPAPLPQAGEGRPNGVEGAKREASVRLPGEHPPTDGPAVIAIAKARREDEEGRRVADRTMGAAADQIVMPGGAPFLLPPRDPALFFLQRLRDEAHRFAIGAHRAKRKKSLGVNPLDEIPGVGAARKRALLNHFGSAREVARAKPEDLSAVAGVSAALAQRIYDYFHAS
jgi:excinuclease ABC subunit C